MKKILITITILTVLLVGPSLVFANNTREVDVSIGSIGFEPDSMVVRVQGVLPTRCTTYPHPKLTKTDSDSVLILRIAAETTAELCMLMLGGDYDLAFDIRSLKFDLENLGLDPDATYTILTEDYSFSVEVNFAEVQLNLPYSSKHIFGKILTVENDGRYAVAVSSSEILNVNSPFIDMNKYVGEAVEVMGHVVKARTPSLGVSAAANSSPTYLITGISTIAH
ncbi:MAG: hypothetical protein A2Z20_06365 [Bdellovibrionales bacterium RBG_16_40_8]|nr:MAG: hypothetical protein A2Z20_06365 [Bdellovibrionales bacterium RBG_16_40_8]